MTDGIGRMGMSAGLAAVLGCAGVRAAEVGGERLPAEECCAMTAAAADVRPYPAPGGPVSRLRAEGIRAMSSGDPEKMAAAGFNLVLPWEQILRGSRKTTPPDSPVILGSEDFSHKAVARLRSRALQCKKNNLIMMYMMYVAAESSVRHLTGFSGNLLDYVQKGEGASQEWPAHQYRHVVDWDGQAARWAPCPLERRYWMGFIRPQLELVARVLNETGATGGGALELETYCFYSIYPGMASQKKTFCYCDHCFAGFVQSLGERGTSVEVAPGQRFDWLTERGLLGGYERHLEDSMSELIKEVMQEVRRINPGFLFGFYPYAPFWYYDALIRGSGTPELPCLLFASPEYSGGYMAGPPYTFFSDVPTPAGVAHLRRRKLPAMYAGGLWAKNMASPDAVATAMDRMLRGPDGYWIYNDFGHTKETVPQRLWDQSLVVNRWTTAHPGPLPAGDMVVDLLNAAMKWVGQNKPGGIGVSNGRIVARYDGRGDEVPLGGGGFDNPEAVAEGWKGRGSLPPLDESVFHSGRASIRFEPSAAGKGPRSPYIDHQVPGAEEGQSYELSFWVRTAGGGEPIRFWVGRANSSEHPWYMYYGNYILPPDLDWMRLRLPARYKDHPPLVLRFWCPPTDGRLWLDDVRLRPAQPRSIYVPLDPPADAAGWGTVDWKLSPPDARCDATIVDAKDKRSLRMRLYSGDSLAPLAAVVGLKPVLLSLEVYPSAAEPVILQEVRIRFTSKSS